MEIYILGSGSSGNSTLVRSTSGRILIDAGMSCKQLAARLESCGQTIAELDGILLTHEHGDHTNALQTLCKKHPVPIYSNHKTADALRFRVKNLQAKWVYFQTAEPFCLGGFSIRPFTVQHDAAEPVGFRIEQDGKTFSVLTDLGKVTRSVIDATKNSHCIFIEANYDPKMLEADTKRPWSTKQRILAPHGHLSNLSAAESIQAMASEKLQTVILGHLSEDCNCPQKASQLVASHLAAAGAPHVTVCCAERNAVTEKISIR